MMDPAQLQSFNEAVALAQDGRKAAAYQGLARLANSNPNDENILLWLAFTTPDLKESERAITQIKLLNPANPNLGSAAAWLERERATNKLPTIVPPFDTTSTIAQRPTPHPGAVVVSPGSQFVYFLSCLGICILLVMFAVWAGYSIEPAKYIVYVGSYKDGTYVYLIVAGLVVSTTIWAAIDASERRRKLGAAIARDGAAGIIFGCILLWLVFFPWYLTIRRRLVSYYGI
jgi:hypothetical protein